MQCICFTFPLYISGVTQICVFRVKGQVKARDKALLYIDRELKTSNDEEFALESPCRVRASVRK